MDVLSKNGLKIDVVKEFFKQHFENCIPYHNYCMSKGITPDDITDISNLKNIPLIPTAMFKKHKIISVDEANIVKECTSSGTNGGLSKVYRDQITLDNIRDGLISQAKELFAEDILDYSLYSLGPDKTEAKDLWIAFILSLLEDKMKEQKYFVQDNKFMLINFVEQLKEDIKEDKKHLVIGPPIFFLYLVKELKGQHIPLNKNSLLITMGGWKKFKDLAIERSALEQDLADIFELPIENIRDAYSSVEINTALLECKCKHKHIPKWLNVVAIDPETRNILPYDEEGILAFIDTSANSYPCLIISEDFGIIHNDSSECGFENDYVEITRRVEGVEAKGCAIKSETTEVSTTEE